MIRRELSFVISSSFFCNVLFTYIDFGTRTGITAYELFIGGIVSSSRGFTVILVDGLIEMLKTIVSKLRARHSFLNIDFIHVDVTSDLQAIQDKLVRARTFAVANVITMKQVLYINLSDKRADLLRLRISPLASGDFIVFDVSLSERYVTALSIRSVARLREDTSS